MSKKQVAFVSAPWRAPSLYYVKQNRLNAERIAEALWLMGYAVICPHKNSQDFDGFISDAEFMDGTLEILRRCDLVVTNERFHQSEGTMKELRAAYLARIPVYKWHHGDPTNLYDLKLEEFEMYA